MSTLQDVVIVGCARTAVGDYGGSLKDVPAIQLGSIAIKEALNRANVPAADVQQVVMGNVIPGEARDQYLSRVASVEAGVPHSAPALTLNRLCGSGVQAIISAAQMIRLGEADVAIGGGAESMSRGAYLLPNLRWGQRMGDGNTVDLMVGVLTDPFGNGHMGITAENVAARYGITREDQDAFALESHRRAAKAVAEGRFADQIVPVELKSRKGVKLFATDEHVRPDVTAEDLAGLRSAFKKDGTVTAGNASGVNDGAGAAVLMSADEAKKRGLKPLVRIASWNIAGVDPAVMGIGPIEAVPTALKRAGIGVKDLDVIESNEAFAAQSLAVLRGLDLPADKTNPNGGAVALGHPVAATGAIITVKLIYELQRIKGRYGLVTMCIGGGQGIALVLERL